VNEADWALLERYPGYGLFGAMPEELAGQRLTITQVLAQLRPPSSLLACFHARSVHKIAAEIKNFTALNLRTPPGDCPVVEFPELFALHQILKHDCPLRSRQ
jgi:hypothetical protein